MKFSTGKEACRIHVFGHECEDNQAQALLLVVFVPHAGDAERSEHAREVCFHGGREADSHNLRGSKHRHLSSGGQKVMTMFSSGNNTTAIYALLAHSGFVFCDDFPIGTSAEIML